MLPKILTKDEKERKERKMKTVLTVFIIVILAASTAGFALDLSGKKEKEEYREFKFYRTEDGSWKEKNHNFATTYLPQDVENISSFGVLRLIDLRNKVYFVSAQNRPAALEIATTVYIENIQPACLPEQKDEAICEDLPLKNCGDAEFGTGVIIFREENETEVRYENYCLEISGENEEELIKAADKAIFMAYGIIA